MTTLSFGSTTAGAAMQRSTAKPRAIVLGQLVSAPVTTVGTSPIRIRDLAEIELLYEFELLDALVNASSRSLTDLRDVVVCVFDEARVSRTSAGEPFFSHRERANERDATVAGAVGDLIEQPPPVDNARKLAELRRISGLTIDQVARAFGVSRRAVHHWASGSAMNSQHEEKLHRVLSVLQRCGRGSASANRAALVDVGADGRAPLDLLFERKYEEAIKRLGMRAARAAELHTPSAKLLAERAPLSPAEILDRLDDGPAHQREVVRVNKSRKVRR
jgi:DNA-binding transcriptional regulator YiaG